jgi:hypothetical protein
MPQASTYHQQMLMTMPVYHPGQGMIMNVGQYPQGAGNMPMMQMGQQHMAASMLMNHYTPNQQPNQMPRYFWWAGAGSDKLFTSVNTNRFPTPTHNYALLQPPSSSKQLMLMPPP